MRPVDCRVLMVFPGLGIRVRSTFTRNEHPGQSRPEHVGIGHRRPEYYRPSLPIGEGFFHPPEQQRPVMTTRSMELNYDSDDDDDLGVVEMITLLITQVTDPQAPSLQGLHPHSSSTAQNTGLTHKNATTQNTGLPSSSSCPKTRDSLPFQCTTQVLLWPFS